MDTLSCFPTRKLVCCHQNVRCTANFRSTLRRDQTHYALASTVLKEARASVFGCCSVFGAGCNLSLPENAPRLADSRAIAGKVQPALIFSTSRPFQTSAVLLPANDAALNESLNFRRRQVIAGKQARLIRDHDRVIPLI